MRLISSRPPVAPAVLPLSTLITRRMSSFTRSSDATLAPRSGGCESARRSASITTFGRPVSRSTPMNSCTRRTVSYGLVTRSW